MTIEIDEYRREHLDDKKGLLLAVSCPDCSFSERMLGKTLKEIKRRKKELRSLHLAQSPDCPRKLRFETTIFDYR